MSHRPAGPSRSGHPSPQLSPAPSFAPMQPPCRTSPHHGPMNPSISLPSLRHLSATSSASSDRQHANPLGLHTMLNPESDMAEQHRGRRRSHSQMDSPSPVDTQQHAHSWRSISRPSSVGSQQDDVKALRLFPPPDRPARHVLSPKSQVHRTALIKPTTGTIDAQQTPFLTANTRPSDPPIQHQALPTPPPGLRTASFQAGPSDAPTPPPHVARPDTRRVSISFPQSGAASPMTHYSPYSQAATLNHYDHHSGSGPCGSTPSLASVHVQDACHVSVPMEPDHGSMIPMAPSALGSIQLMTIKGQQGRPVQIPVDVQAASKVADEKRRRNAGASARFRARRKEKEREASISISRLEQQLRGAIEDADFYREERDYFKSVVMQQPGAEQLYARAQSPRLRRHSIAPSIAGSDLSHQEYQDESPRDQRNVRQRTSTYRPVSGPAPSDPASTIAPPGHPLASFAPLNLPPVQAVPYGQHYAPHHSSPIHRPGFRDPFANNSGRVENRS